MDAIRVNKNTKVNQVSSRTQSVRSDSNLIDFFIRDIMMRNTKGQFVKGNKPWTTGKYCSEETRKKISEALLGRKHTKKAKRKMSMSHKGMTHSNFCSLESRKRISKAQKKRFKENSMPEETKRKIGKANICRVRSKEARENYSKAAKKRYENPENHPRWKGGISWEIYPREFRQIKGSIRERDNHTCQFCSEQQKPNGRKLDVHHIDYDKNNCNPENLITLCCSCNIGANDDRDAWKRVFQNMIKKKSVGFYVCG